MHKREKLKKNQKYHMMDRIKIVTEMQTFKINYNKPKGSKPLKSLIFFIFVLRNLLHRNMKFILLLKSSCLKIHVSFEKKMIVIYAV